MIGNIRIPAKTGVISKIRGVFIGYSSICGLTATVHFFSKTLKGLNTFAGKKFYVDETNITTLNHRKEKPAPTFGRWHLI